MKNNLSEFTIRKPVKSDAAAMLEYLKIVGGESEFLSFGKEGHPNTVEQEEAYIESLDPVKNHIMLLVTHNGEIIADGSLGGTMRERMKHSLELGISVKKAYWHQGVGTMLLNALIEEAKKLPHIVQVTLEVREDNVRAFRLYERLGFVTTGRRAKRFLVNGVFYDTIVMVKPLV